MNELAGDLIEREMDLMLRGGDCIDIPSGMPRQIDIRGKKPKMVIVKINL